MFSLSAIPEVQQKQLRELVTVSEQKLRELTSPVSVLLPYEMEEPLFKMYDPRMLVYDYQPPATRFARFSPINFTSLDFE